MEKNNITFNDIPDNKPKVDLSSVEEVKLPNKHRYVKYTDLENNTPVMLAISGDKTAQQIIEDIQSTSNSYSSNDAIFNTNGILEHEKKYMNQDILIIPIANIDNYRYAFNSMTDEQRQIVNLFIKNKDRFNPNLRYINVDEAIAIDENGKVLTCVLNPQTNRLEVNYADVVKYENTKQTVENKTEGSLDDIDFEVVFDTIETSNEPFEVAGYKVDIQTLEQYDQYPEVLERKQMAERERYIWMRLLNIFRKRKQAQQMADNPPKVRVLNQNNNKNKASYPNSNDSDNEVPPKNAGYASQLLTVSLATFAIGVIFGILIFVLKIFT